MTAEGQRWLNFCGCARDKSAVLLTHVSPFKTMSFINACAVIFNVGLM